MINIYSQYNSKKDPSAIITADWRKRYHFVFKTVAIILIFAFVLYDVTWAQEGFPVWQHAKINSPENRSGNEIQDLSIPTGKVEVEDTYRNGGKDIVLNIQDAHASLSAQYSIAETLDYLVTNYNLNLIAVEGSEGYIDTSILRTFPDKNIKREAAEDLMKEGVMSAGEFFAVVSDKPVALYGIENNELYRKNVEAFQNIFSERADSSRYIEALTNSLSKLEDKIYKEDLKELNRKAFLYKKGELPFSEYFAFLSLLAQNYNVILDNYANTSRFSNAIKLEKEIDFDKANDERKTLIDALSRALSKDKLEELVLKAVSFKKGEVSKAAFHLYLVDLAESDKVDPSPYKNLINFTGYILIHESIDLFMLQSEAESIESAIREKLFTTKEERELYELEKKTWILKGLFNITLTNSELKYLMLHRHEFDAKVFNEFLKKNYRKYKLVLEEVPDVDYLITKMDEAIEFYNIIQRRNNAMIENTILHMRKEKQNVACLITGGFHSNGLAGIMKAKGLSYLVVSPKFEAGKERPYIAVLTKKIGPYKKLIASGQYELAVSQYMSTGNLEAFAGIIGRMFKKIEAQALEEMKKSWGLSYRLSYKMLSEMRKGAMTYERVTPDEFEDFLAHFTPEAINRLNGIKDTDLNGRLVFEIIGYTHRHYAAYNEKPAIILPVEGDQRILRHMDRVLGEAKLNAEDTAEMTEEEFEKKVSGLHAEISDLEVAIAEQSREKAEFIVAIWDSQAARNENDKLIRVKNLKETYKEKDDPQAREIADLEFIEAINMKTSLKWRMISDALNTYREVLIGLRDGKLDLGNAEDNSKIARTAFDAFSVYEILTKREGEARWIGKVSEGIAIRNFTERKLDDLYRIVADIHESLPEQRRYEFERGMSEIKARVGEVSLPDVIDPFTLEHIKAKVISIRLLFATKEEIEDMIAAADSTITGRAITGGVTLIHENGEPVTPAEIDALKRGEFELLENTGAKRSFTLARLETTEHPRQPTETPVRDAFSIQADELLNTMNYGFLIPHVRRATAVNIRIAKALNLPEGEIRLLQYASLLHDVGAGIRGQYQETFSLFSRSVIAAFPDKPKLSTKSAVDLLISRQAERDRVNADAIDIGAKYRLFRRALTDILGRDLSGDIEEAVAYSVFDVPENTLRILKEKGIKLSKGLEVLLKYHNDYQKFLKDVPAFAGELDISEEDAALLISILFLTDIFEHGNNKETQFNQRKKTRVENFPETIQFIEEKFAQEKISDMRALQALKSLIAEKDELLFNVIAEARETTELMPEDMEFIKTHRRSPPKVGSGDYDEGSGTHLESSAFATGITLKILADMNLIPLWLGIIGLVAAIAITLYQFGKRYRIKQRIAEKVREYRLPVEASLTNLRMKGIYEHMEMLPEIFEVDGMLRTRRLFEFRENRWNWKHGDGLYLLTGAPFEGDINGNILEIENRLRQIEPDPKKLFLQPLENLHISIAEFVPNTEQINAIPDADRERERKIHKAINVASSFEPIKVRFYYKNLTLTNKGDIVALGYVDNESLFALRNELQNRGISSRYTDIVHFTIGRIFDEGISPAKFNEYKELISELRHSKDRYGNHALLGEITVDNVKFWDQRPPTNELRYGEAHPVIQLRTETAREKPKAIHEKEVLKRFEEMIKDMINADKMPLWVSNLDGTITVSNNPISDENLKIIVEILKLNIPFVVLTGISRDRMERQFLTPLLEHISKDERDILRNLVIATDNGTQIYEFDETIKDFKVSFAVDLKAYVEEEGREAGKYDRIPAIIDECIEKTNVREVLRRTMGWEWKTEEEWEDFKRSCFDERKVGNKITQITYMVIGKNATRQDKQRFHERGGEAIRRNIEPIIEEALRNERILLEAKVSGLSSIDISLPGIDKGFGIDMISQLLASRFGITNPQAIIDRMIFSGDAFEPEDNDEPVLKVNINRLINVGTFIDDITKSRYYGEDKTRNIKFFQLPGTGPNGLSRFGKIFVDQLRQLEEKRKGPIIPRIREFTWDEYNDILSNWIPVNYDVTRILGYIQEMAVKKDRVVIVDIGTGTGFIPLYLAEKLAQFYPDIAGKVQFIGIDHSNERIEKFRNRLGLEKIGERYVKGNVTLAIADAGAAPDIVRDIIKRDDTADMVIHSWSPMEEDFTFDVLALHPDMVIFAKPSEESIEQAGTEETYNARYWDAYGYDEAAHWPIFEHSYVTRYFRALPEYRNADDLIGHLDRDVELQKGGEMIVFKMRHEPGPIEPELEEHIMQLIKDRNIAALRGLLYDENEAVREAVISKIKEHATGPQDKDIRAIIEPIERSVKFSPPKVAYYPASGISHDRITVGRVIDLHPSINTFILVDQYAFKDLNSKEDIERAKRSYDMATIPPGEILGEPIFSNEGERIEFNVKLARNDKVVKFILYKKDIYGLSPLEIREGRAVHIVKLPGTSGNLSRDINYYVKMISDMKVGDLLYVANARQPVEFVNLDRVGLALISGQRWVTGSDYLLDMRFYPPAIFEKIKDIKMRELGRVLAEDFEKEKEYRSQEGVEDEASHDFTAMAGFKAAFVTGILSVLGLIWSGRQYFTQGDFITLTLAIGLAGLYFGWATVRYFLVGRATYKELTKYGISPEDVFRYPIATSEGYRHTAFYSLPPTVQRFVNLHEGFRSHILGMIAMMPILSRLAITPQEKFMADIMGIWPETEKYSDRDGSEYSIVVTGSLEEVDWSKVERAIKIPEESGIVLGIIKDEIKRVTRYTAFPWKRYQDSGEKYHGTDINTIIDMRRIISILNNPKGLRWLIEDRKRLQRLPHLDIDPIMPNLTEGEKQVVLEPIPIEPEIASHIVGLIEEASKGSEDALIGLELLLNDENEVIRSEVIKAIEGYAKGPDYEAVRNLLKRNLPPESPGSGKPHAFRPLSWWSIIGLGGGFDWLAISGFTFTGILFYLITNLQSLTAGYLMTGITIAVVSFAFFVTTHTRLQDTVKAIRLAHPEIGLWQALTTDIGHDYNALKELKDFSPYIYTQILCHETFGHHVLGLMAFIPQISALIDAFKIRKKHQRLGMIIVPSALRKFKKVLNEITKRGGKPVLVCDLDGTITESNLPISSENIKAIIEILESGQPFVVLSGISKERIDYQFLNPLLSFIPSGKRRILQNLIIASDNGTQIYKYNKKSRGFKCIFANDIRKSMNAGKYNQIFKILNTCIEELNMRGMLEEKLGWKFTDDKWRTFKKSCIVKRKVGRKVTQVTLMVTGRKAGPDEKREFHESGGGLIRHEYVRYISNALNESGIELSAKVSGLSSIDITLPDIDKGFGIRTVSKYFNIPLDDIIFFGDAFHPGDNDEPVLKTVNKVVNLGPRVDIRQSYYYRKGMKFLQLPDTGPEGFMLFGEVFARVKSQPEAIRHFKNKVLAFLPNLRTPPREHMPKKNIMGMTARKILKGVPRDIQNHSLRNARIAALIALELGLPKEDMNLLQHVAWAHDIGQGEKSQYPEALRAINEGMQSLPTEDRVEPVKQNLEKWLKDIAPRYGVSQFKAKEIRKEVKGMGDYYPIWEAYIKYAVLRKSTFLTAEEEAVTRSMYKHGYQSIKVLDGRNIYYPEEMALLIACHHDFTELEDRLGIAQKNGAMTLAQAERLRLLGSVIVVSDTFEQGNNYERIVLMKGKPRVETFAETFNGYMRKRFDEIEDIKERRPLEALKTLIGRRDSELFRVIADARQTTVLMPEDIEFIASQSKVSPKKLKIVIGIPKGTNPAKIAKWEKAIRKYENNIEVIKLPTGTVEADLDYLRSKAKEKNVQFAARLDLEDIKIKDIESIVDSFIEEIDRDRFSLVYASLAGLSREDVAAKEVSELQDMLSVVTGEFLNLRAESIDERIARGEYWQLRGLRADNTILGMEGLLAEMKQVEEPHAAVVSNVMIESDASVLAKVKAKRLHKGFAAVKDVLTIFNPTITRENVDAYLRELGAEGVFDEVILYSELEAKEGKLDESNIVRVVKSVVQEKLNLDAEHVVLVGGEVHFREIAGMVVAILTGEIDKYIDELVKFLEKYGSAYEEALMGIYTKDEALLAKLRQKRTLKEESDSYKEYIEDYRRFIKEVITKL